MVLVFFQDEECLRPGDATDTTFLEKLEETVKNHPHFLTWVHNWSSFTGGSHMCDRACKFNDFEVTLYLVVSVAVASQIDWIPQKNENVFICKEVKLWVMVIQDQQL